MTVTVTLLINTSPAEVWEAMTNPDLVKKYFFGTHLESDWKVGSPIKFSGEWEGTLYEDKGIILEIRPHALLKYNYWSSFSGTEDIPENYSNITYALVEVEGQTELTVTQEGIKDEKARDHSMQNWKMVLGAMKELLEA